MALTNERRERAFQEALSYDSFIKSVQVNQESFLANYSAYDLTEEDLSLFTELDEPVEVLVLAHDWCGDVVANLPLFGKIQAKTDKLHLHILERDPHNTDIAEAYPLPEDGRNHIPTYIFYDQAGNELGVFIERSAELSALLKGWVANFFETHPEFASENKSIKDLPNEVRTALLGKIKEERAKVIDLEKSSILQAIAPIIKRTPVAHV